MSPRLRDRIIVTLAVVSVVGFVVFGAWSVQHRDEACVAALDGYRYVLTHPTAPDMQARATQTRADEATCRR